MSYYVALQNAIHLRIRNLIIASTCSGFVRLKFSWFYRNDPMRHYNQRKGGGSQHPRLNIVKSFVYRRGLLQRSSIVAK